MFYLLNCLILFMLIIGTSKVNLIMSLARLLTRKWLLYRNDIEYFLCVCFFFLHNDLFFLKSAISGHYISNCNTVCEFVFFAFKINLLFESKFKGCMQRNHSIPKISTSNVVNEYRNSSDSGF